MRFYAIEALFNVCKVSGPSLLIKPETRFNAVFHGLCKAFADVDPEAKNAAQVLDRLLKVIVSESEGFDLDGVVPLFQSYLKVKNPFIRQLLVSWISALDAVPDLDVVKRLPALLDGLLDMLSDANKSIRDSAEKTLGTFLKEIANRPLDVRKKILIPPNIEVLLRRRSDSTRTVRSICLHWLGEFIHSAGDVLIDRFADFLQAVVDGVSEHEADVVVDNAEIRVLARRFDKELQQIISSTPAGKTVNEKSLIKVAIANLSHPDRAVRETCLTWISLLLDVVPDRFITSTPADEFLVPQLVQTLKDPIDNVVAQSLGCLARIARNAKTSKRILSALVEKFEQDRELLEDRGAFIVRNLCVLLKPSTIYLVLADIIASRRVRDSQDFVFAGFLVQTLNAILLTAIELRGVRVDLRASWRGGQDVAAPLAVQQQTQQPPQPSEKKKNGQVAVEALISPSSSPSPPPPAVQTTTPDEDVTDVGRMFDTIFCAWSHNPVSALCLSLLGGAYGLAGRLVEIMGESEITVDVLVDADRLVKLLESPIMLHVRMQLLKTGPDFEPDLLKSLYGLLMLLPQKSEAFKVLDSRLSAVTAMHTVLSRGGSSAGGPVVATAAAAAAAGSTVDVLRRQQYLLREFARVQELHVKKTKDAGAVKSLLG